MPLQPPEVSAIVRIQQSNLSDVELAYIVDLIYQSQKAGDKVPGWSVDASIRMDGDFIAAASRRGIAQGVKVITQTIDLRY